MPNIEIKEEDIEVVLHRVPMSTYDGDRDVGAFHLEIMEDWSESDANQLKSQILQNQKLRQLVEERIELMNKTIVTPKHCKEILESLLDKAKSGYAGEKE